MALDNSKKTFDRTVELFKAGSLDEAEEVCRSITKRDPRDINFLSLLGSVLLRKDNFEEAETVLKSNISNKQRRVTKQRYAPNKQASKQEPNKQRRGRDCV